jgi:hypothetical protein
MILLAIPAGKLRQPTAREDRFRPQRFERFRPKPEVHRHEIVAG